MNNYSYYTPDALATALLALVPKNNINSMIDICCGSWNLLRAAKKKHPHAKVTGIDIDKTSKNYLIPDAVFKMMDGRDFAIKEYKKGATYDLILSNPPFGLISNDQRKYETHRYDRGFYSHLLTKRYECEMVQANMLLAHSESILIFILPHTFVAGDSFLRARKQIAQDYSISKIVRLPDSTFQQGNIRTFAVIMKKTLTAESTAICLAKNDKEWRIDKVKELDSAKIKEGYWWQENKPDMDSLNIARGKISTALFANDGQRILHCSSKGSDVWSPSTRFFNKDDCTYDIITANKGDVIINRIGKAAGYWCINTSDSIAVSDCLLVIKDVTDSIKKTLKKNSDKSGRLCVPIRGVATPYITANDIKSLF